VAASGADALLAQLEAENDAELMGLGIPGATAAGRRSTGAGALGTKY
jgi:hypothetical protein